jgi:hypothetical protein
MGNNQIPDFRTDLRHDSGADQNFSESISPHLENILKDIKIKNNNSTAEHEILINEHFTSYHLLIH